jgi:hypothetical protein
MSILVTISIRIVGTIKTRIVLSGCLVLFLTVVSLAQQTREGAVENTSFLGSLDNGVYSNSFFGFKFKVPENVTVLNRAEIAIFKNAGADLIKANNERNGKAINDSFDKEVILVNLANKPLGSSDNSILVVGTRKQPAGVTANMILAETVKLLSPTGKFKVTKILSDPKIGGKAFAGMEFATEVNGQNLNQRMFVHIRRGYSLVVAITFISADGLKAIEKITDGIEFFEK